MDIKSIMSKLQSIESMNRITEADDPAAVIQKYTDMGKKPTPDMPAFIDPKDGKVKWMDKGTGMGQQPQIKVMPTDWIKRYAPDLAAALDAQGGNKAAYGSQEQGSFLGIKYNNGTKVNTTQAGADQTSAKFKADKLKQLNDLVAKLNAETQGGNSDPAVGKVDYSLGGAPGGTGLKLRETLLREFSIDEDDSTLKVYDPKNGGATYTEPNKSSAPAAGGDTLSQLQAVMKELADMGDDPEVAKALAAAQKAIDAKKAAKPPAQAGAPGSPAAQPGAEAGGGGAAVGGDKARADILKQSGTSEDEIKRFKELVAKAKAGNAPAGGSSAQPVRESNSAILALHKLRLLESVILEALTPEEQKELDTLAKKFSGNGLLAQDPDVSAALADYKTISGGGGGGGSAPQPATGGGDPKVLALQQALIKAGAKIKADGKMGPATSAAMAQFPDVAKQFPDVKPAAGGAKNPKLAPLTKILSQIEPIIKKAAAPAAAPAPVKGAAPAGAAPAAKSAPVKGAAPAAAPVKGAAPANAGANNMSEAERYRALVNKLESINNPVNGEEKVDEVAPLVVAGGVAAVLAALKGGSDYLDKLAAAKKAAGGLKPEEVKQLADLINQMEEMLADEQTKAALDADKELSKRVADIGNKARTLSDQAGMANQSAAQTFGGTVGAAVKEPFRMVGRGISAATNAVGDFFKGAGAAQ